MSEVTIVKPVRFDGVVTITVRKKGARSGSTALAKLFQDFKKFNEKEKVAIAVQRGKKKIGQMI